MTTRFDATWLPINTRYGWDGTEKNGPINYGSGEYGHIYKALWLSDTTSAKSKWYEEYSSASPESLREIRKISINIFHIIEWYTKWNNNSSVGIRQLYTDNGATISSDDVLWYLRYENIRGIARLLDEQRYSSGIIQISPHYWEKDIPKWTLPHSLVRAIKKAIDGLHPIRENI